MTARPRATMQSGHRCHSGWPDPPIPAYDLTPGGDGKTQLCCTVEFHPSGPAFWVTQPN